MNIGFNKNKIQKRVAQDAIYKFVCHEGTENKVVDNVLYGKYNENNIGNGCDFYVAPDSRYNESTNTPVSLASKEFVTVTLIGGGAGMGPNKYPGNAGERKEVIFPSLVMPRPINREVPGSSNICTSPMCSDCDVSGTCKKCITGYKLKNGDCQLNFKYRAIIGKGGTGRKSSEKGGNGGQTSLLMIGLDTGKVLGVVETASGGLTSSEESDDKNCKKSDSEEDYGSGGCDTPFFNDGKSGEVTIQW